MQVVNKTSFPIIASCGTGAERQILPGGLAEVLGPQIDDISGRRCYKALPGILICKEESDGNSHKVIQGNPLRIKADGITIVICHHLDSYILNTPKENLSWGDQK